MNKLKNVYIAVIMLYFTCITIYNVGYCIYYEGYYKGVKDTVEDVHSTLREHLQEEFPDVRIKERSELVNEM